MLRKWLPAAVFLVLALLLVACQPATTPAPTAAPSATPLPPTPLPTATPSPEPTSTPVIEAGVEMDAAFFERLSRWAVQQGLMPQPVSESEAVLNSLLAAAQFDSAAARIEIKGDGAVLAVFYRFTIGGSEILLGHDNLPANAVLPTQTHFTVFGRLPSGQILLAVDTSEQPEGGSGAIRSQFMIVSPESFGSLMNDRAILDTGYGFADGKLTMPDGSSVELNKLSFVGQETQTAEELQKASGVVWMERYIGKDGKKYPYPNHAVPFPDVGLPAGAYFVPPTEGNLPIPDGAQIKIQVVPTGANVAGPDAKKIVATSIVTDEEHPLTINGNTYTFGEACMEAVWNKDTKQFEWKQFLNLDLFNKETWSPEFVNYLATAADLEAAPGNMQLHEDMFQRYGVPMMMSEIFKLDIGTVGQLRLQYPALDAYMNGDVSAFLNEGVSDYNGLMSFIQEKRIAQLRETGQELTLDAVEVPGSPYAIIETQKRVFHFPLTGEVADAAYNKYILSNEAFVQEIMEKNGGVLPDEFKHQRIMFGVTLNLDGFPNNGFEGKLAGLFRMGENRVMMVAHHTMNGETFYSDWIYKLEGDPDVKSIESDIIGINEGTFTQSDPFSMTGGLETMHLDKYSDDTLIKQFGNFTTGGTGYVAYSLDNGEAYTNFFNGVTLKGMDTVSVLNGR